MCPRSPRPGAGVLRLVSEFAFSAVARVSYYQQGSEVYDRDEGVLYFRDIVEHELPFAVERKVIVHLGLEDHKVTVTDIQIEYGRVVRVFVNEDDPCEC